MAVAEDNREAGVQVPAPFKQHPGGPFQTGHKRFGGRVKGTPNKRNRLAVEMAAGFKMDPVMYMLTILNSDTVDVPLTNDLGVVVKDIDGKPVMVTLPITLEMKLDAAKNVAPYVHARLQATQVTGADDGPLAVALPTQKILEDPAMTAKLSELALMVAESQPEDGSN